MCFTPSSFCKKPSTSEVNLLYSLHDGQEMVAFAVAHHNRDEFGFPPPIEALSFRCGTNL